MSRIAIISPGIAGQPSGNKTTMRRLARGLRGRGHEVLEVLCTSDGALLPDLRSPPRLDILHALHARRTGRRVRELSRALGVPYVVSVTGTDIYEDISRKNRRGELEAVLTEAGAVLSATSLDPAMRRLLPNLDSRWIVAVKGIDASLVAPPASAADEGSTRFLHVGGWRAIKNQLFVLEPLRRLAGVAPHVTLRFVGPVLDAAYFARWLAVRDRYPFATACGVVCEDAMAAEYQAASIVINCSHAEGGANAVLEAMAAERPTLVSDVHGNRSFVDFRDDAWERSTGVIYATSPSGDPDAYDERVHDPEDFFAKAHRLARDSALRAAIGINARRSVEALHSAPAEIDQVLAAYRLAGIREL